MKRDEITEWLKYISRLINWAVDSWSNFPVKQKAENKSVSPNVEIQRDEETA